MIFSLKQYLSIIDFDKFRNLRITRLKNSYLALIGYTPPGAMEITIIEAQKECFNDLFIFYSYIKIRNKINLIRNGEAETFLNQEFQFEKTEQNNVIHYINGYNESFMDLTSDNLWLIKSASLNYCNLYKEIDSGSHFCLVAETENFYVFYQFISID